MHNENEIISYPNIKQSWGLVGISILFMLLLSPVYLLLNNIGGEEISLLVYYVLSVGATFWIAHSNRKKITGTSDFNLKFSTPKILLLTSIAIVALQIGLVSPLVSLIPMPEFMKQMLLQYSTNNGIFTFLTIVVVAPVLEELIFRGIILDGLLKKYSPVRSILFSSILFGVIHLNPWQFIAALIIGIFSGWIYYRTQKLILCILIHFVNNLLAFSSTYFQDVESIIDKSLIEQYGGVLNTILFTTAALSVATACIYLLSSEIEKTERLPQSTISTSQNSDPVSTSLEVNEPNSNIPSGQE